MPATLDELATPLLYIIPLHLFAHQMALKRGWDPLSRRYEDIVPQKVRYSGA
jgi:glucosamine 6-phosphate synthetase-like amidotransferase/phosphosugar isomerase protein